MKRIFSIIILSVIPLLLAAQKGKKDYDLSIQYEKGTSGIKRDYKKSEELLNKAAKAGYAQAQYKLGHNLFSVIGDPANAIPWLQKAAEQGHDEAAYDLGIMYANGRGFTQDKQKALEILLPLAEKGHEGAIINVAIVYGELGKKEEARDKLKELRRRGAEHGSAILMRSLAEEEEENANYAEALKWYEEAWKNRSKLSSSSQRDLKIDLDRTREKAKNDVAMVERDSVEIARIGSDVDKDIPVAKQTQDKTFALIIANENYDGVVPVPYAKNDATTFEMYCRQTLGIPGDNIHTLKDATYGQMKRGVVWLQDIIKAYQGEAQVIVYYAGHGIPDEKSRAGYLLPTDGNPMNPASAYALEDLYKELVEQPSRSIVVLLDACFSGARREGTMLTSARGVAIKVKPEQPAGNLVVFSATQGDETAYAYDEQKHGLFTYYMLKKMKETNGSLTLGELSDFVRQQVMQQSVKYNGKLQTPTVTSPSSLSDKWRTLKLIP